MNKSEFISISNFSDIVGLSENDLKSHSRKHSLKFARFAYWFYLNKSPIEMTVTQIANLFNRNHGSIRNGINQILNYVETNDSAIKPYREIFIDPFLFNKSNQNV